MALSNDKQYVPDELDFIDSWACAHVTPHDMTAEEAKDAARAFLGRVRRDAWDEGFQDGRRYDGEGDDGPRYTNPYSGQDADQ